MPGVHTFYDGSKVFEDLAQYVGVGVDQVNLVISQIICIFSAFIFYYALSPARATKQNRQAYLFMIGLCLCYFCFGNAIKHLLSLILISYGIMRYSPPAHVHRLVFIFAMGYLLFIHWYRWYILTAYYIDVTGPMMVLVQKVTVLAFSLHDGRVKKKEELNEIQKREAISQVPPLLDYLSYMFQFQTILTGPLYFYTDYQRFISGENLKVGENKTVTPWKPALCKIAFAAVCLTLIMYFGPTSDPNLVAEPVYMAMPWYKWAGFFFFVIFMQRVQYYYAWTLADAVCNLSGFGFNGFDDKGEPKWDLVSNVDPYKVEMALSFKETLDAWNCTTMYWLRRVAYDRVPKRWRTFSTYFLSAAWHGLFMGYYMTFLTGALITIAARTVRRCVRWRFQGSKQSRFFYDVLTFLATKVALAYATYPFVTIHMNPGFFIYKRTYFFVHVLAIMAILILPKVLPQPRSEKPKENGKVEKEHLKEG